MRDYLETIKPDWKPVSEYPLPGEHVLVTECSGKVCETMCRGDDWWLCADDEYVDSTDILAWMKMPPKWNKDDEDKDGEACTD